MQRHGKKQQLQAAAFEAAGNSRGNCAKYLRSRREEIAILARKWQGDSLNTIHTNIFCPVIASRLNSGFAKEIIAGKNLVGKK